MRVLHLPITALYQPALMVLGLRSVGIHSDIMYHNHNLDLGPFEIEDQIIIGNGDISSAGLDFFLQAIKKYDVFHIHSGYSPLFLSRKGKELGFLAKLGKLVVLSRWGCCDGRTPSSWQIERKLCETCPIPRNCCNDTLNTMRLERENRHADIIINHEFDFNEFNNRAVFLHGFIDVDLWRPDLELPEEYQMPIKPGFVRIIHAVGGKNRGDVKGSSAIRTAIEALRKAKHKIEYLEVQGISFSQLRWHILQSDIVVDQLHYGSFGSFARESLALGKPVVGNVIDYQRKHLSNLPIVQADSNSLKDVLKDLIINKDLRRNLGRQGRLFAINELCHINNSTKLVALYERGLEAKCHAIA